MNHILSDQSKFVSNNIETNSKIYIYIKSKKTNFMKAPRVFSNLS